MEAPTVALPSTTTVHLGIGDVSWIEYTIDVTRTARPPALVTGARGTVCVSNVGDAAAADLSITDVVQEMDATGWTNVEHAPVDLAGQTTVASGETPCFPYETPFTARAGARYRSVVQVSASNAVVAQGGDPTLATAAFTLPTVATDAVVEAEAILDDGMRADSVAQWWRAGPCAETYYLFQCTSDDDEGLWRLTGDGSVSFMVDYHNRAACGETQPLTNVAVLTVAGAPGQPPRVHADSATIMVTTDACASPPGCTLTQGYWKQLQHEWPGPTEWERQNLRLWPFFDSGMSWQAMFDTAPSGGDAYVILAHQYMAATLNLANGADAPADVRAARQAAAHYFSLSPAERAAYARDLLIGWADVLDRFNQGLAGVPHCNG